MSFWQRAQNKKMKGQNLQLRLTEKTALPPKERSYILSQALCSQVHLLILFFYDNLGKIEVRCIHRYNNKTYTILKD